MAKRMRRRKRRRSRDRHVLPYGTSPEEQKAYAGLVEQLKKLGAKYDAMSRTEAGGLLYKMSVDKDRIDSVIRKVPAWVLQKLIS
jgi:hypothetical protein